MRQFRFDPPLTLKNNIVVRSLNDAAGMARAFRRAQRPVLQDSAIQRLESASSALQQHGAALAFRDWIDAEGLWAS